jgi:hypothetical protein
VVAERCGLNDNPRFEKEYVGYAQGNDMGDPKFAYHSSYLRVPRKYFPELNVPKLNVPRKRGRSAESGEEDQHGNTAGPQKPRSKGKGKEKE